MRRSSAFSIPGLFGTKLRQDAFWYGFSTALPPVVALFLGPLILKKVGLENFAVLGLMSYFVSMASTYSDFGGFSHLVSVFSKNTFERTRDFASILYLRAIIWVVMGGLLVVAAAKFPRQDVLYRLLVLSLSGMPISLLNIEWYFIARKEYYRIFQAKFTMLSVQVVATLFWIHSSYESILFLPVISILAGLSAFLILTIFLPRGWFHKLFSALGKSSLRTTGTLTVRLLPIVATGLLVPYFLSYAMPWFMLATNDKELQGTFSIAYRLAIGFSSLMAPMVFFIIPRISSETRLSKWKVLGFSLLVTSAFWITGLMVLQMYFAMSKVQIIWLPHARVYFSILMIAVFLTCLRMPFVGKVFISHKYRDYFLIHFFACLPILVLSLSPGISISHEWVPWLACLPDLLATSGFLLYCHRWIERVA